MNIVEGYMKVVDDTPIRYQKQRMLMLKITFKQQKMLATLLDRLD